MICDIYLWFMLLLLLTCGLWFRCRASSGAPSDNLKKLAESELRKEQKRSSTSSDAIIFIESSSNSSFEVIPVEVWSNEKKSSIAGEESNGKVSKKGYTTFLRLEHYDTSDWHTITTADGTYPYNYSLVGHSTGSTISYMDHIRAPTKVFKFYTELEHKWEEENEKSFWNDEYDCAIRGARKTIQSESGSFLCGDVRLLLKRENKENHEYLSLSNRQILDVDLNVERSYTPPTSSSVISVNVCESNSRTLLRLEEDDTQDEEFLSFETYMEPFKGKQNHTSCQRPKEEKPDSSRYPSERRRTCRSSVYLANALCENFLETPSHLKDQQSYKEPKESSDTRVENISALVIEHFKEPSYGTTKIRHRGRTLNLFADPSSTVEAARSIRTCTPIHSSKESSRASMEPENRKRVFMMTKPQSV